MKQKCQLFLFNSRKLFRIDVIPFCISNEHENDRQRRNRRWRERERVKETILHRCLISLHTIITLYIYNRHNQQFSSLKSSMDNFGIIFLFCWACSCKLVTHMCVHCACAFFLQRAKMKMNIFKKKNTHKIRCSWPNMYGIHGEHAFLLWEQKMSITPHSPPKIKNKIWFKHIIMAVERKLSLKTY